MSGRDGSHVKLEGRHELSGRQQEVLGLMSEGRTNYEIAEALDLSLEGAKYHVSEILGKLGVESREEAIAWWQSHRPVRERLPQRMRFLWPALGWVGGVAAVGVAGLVVLGVALYFVGMSPGTPHIWLAVSIPRTADAPGSVVVSEPGTSIPPRVLAQGDFVQVAWSPDGQTLAAIQWEPPDKPKLLLYSRDSWQATSHTLSSMPGESLQWSPDGKHIALVSSTVAFVGPDGTKSSETSPIAPTVDGLNNYYESQFGWSPDSRLFATSINGSTEVTNLAGHVTMLDSTGSGVSADSSKLWPVGWENATTLMVVERPPLPGNYYAVTFGANSQSWKPLSPSDQVVKEVLRGAAGSSQAGNGWTFVPPPPRTADGRGTLSEPPNSLAKSVAGKPIELDVHFNGTTTVAHLPASIPPINNFDVVITGGR